MEDPAHLNGRSLHDDTSVAVPPQVLRLLAYGGWLSTPDLGKILLLTSSSSGLSGETWELLFHSHWRQWSRSQLPPLLRRSDADYEWLFRNMHPGARKGKKNEYSYKKSTMIAKEECDEDSKSECSMVTSLSTDSSKSAPLLLCRSPTVDSYGFSIFACIRDKEGHELVSTVVSGDAMQTWLETGRCSVQLPSQLVVETAPRRYYRYRMRRRERLRDSCFEWNASLHIVRYDGDDKSIIRLGEEESSDDGHWHPLRLRELCGDVQFLTGPCALKDPELLKHIRERDPDFQALKFRLSLHQSARLHEKHLQRHRHQQRLHLDTFTIEARRRFPTGGRYDSRKEVERTGIHLKQLVECLHGW